MPLDYTALASEVLVPASTSLANMSVITSFGWVYFRDYATSGFRLWQKGYVGRDGFAHYFGGGTTSFEYQYFRTTGGVNFACLYSNFPYWRVNNWLFLCVSSDGGAGTKLYVGDLRNPPTEPAAYNFSLTGSGAYKDDSAIALSLGNRGAGAANINGLYHSMVMIPYALAKQDIIQIYNTPPKLWSRLLNNKANGLWRFGTNGRGLVLDESGKNNHGTINTVVPTSDNLPKNFSLGD